MDIEKEIGGIQKLFREPHLNRVGLVEQIRDRAISVLKPITPEGYDLKDPDVVVPFCYTTTDKILFQAALKVLRACTHALESGKIDQHNIDWIVGSYHTLLLMEQKKERSSKGGKQPKLLPGILSAVVKVILGEREEYSVQRLWDYFETHHKGRSEALKINDLKIYFKYKNRNSVEGQIVQLSKDGAIESRGRSAFTGYVKEAKKTLK